MKINEIEEAGSSVAGETGRIDHRHSNHSRQIPVPPGAKLQCSGTDLVMRMPLRDQVQRTVVTQPSKGRRPISVSTETGPDGGSLSCQGWPGSELQNSRPQSRFCLVFICPSTKPRMVNHAPNASEQPQAMIKLDIHDLPQFCDGGTL